MNSQIQVADSASAQHALAKAASDQAQAQLNAPIPLPSTFGYSSSISSKVMTLGVNGATYDMANQLQNLANKLLASGEISPSDANKLLALAQQGFRLAAIEKQVEAASKSAASNQAFLNASITLDGQSVPIPQVQALMGFGSLASPAQEIASNSNYALQTATASPETLAFINLYNDAMSSPNIQNSPTTKGIVSQLSSQISYLSDVTSNLMYGANNPNVSIQSLNSNVISDATTYDSTGICYIGSGCQK